MLVYSTSMAKKDPKIEAGNEVIATWCDIKEVLDQVEIDVIRTAKKRLLASVRLRHKLRALRVLALKMIVYTLKQSKEEKERRKEAAKTSEKKRKVGIPFGEDHRPGKHVSEKA